MAEVSAILSYLAGGATPEALVADFDSIQLEDIYQALAFASENLQSFYSLLARSDAHLLRITKYKQRGDIDGN